VFPAPTLSPFSYNCLLQAIFTEEKESYATHANQDNLHSFHSFADAKKGDGLLPAGIEVIFM
jgi:hypothetical protein